MTAGKHPLRRLGGEGPHFSASVETLSFCVLPELWVERRTRLPCGFSSHISPAPSHLDSGQISFLPPPDSLLWLMCKILQKPGTCVLGLAKVLRKKPGLPGWEEGGELKTPPLAQLSKVGSSVLERGLCSH